MTSSDSYSPLHNPKQATAWVPSLDMALGLARKALTERASANIHDSQAMIAAAVDLEISLRGLIAALDKGNELAAAVAEHGPFPMPVGAVPAEVPGEVLAEVVAAAIRDFDRGVWDGTQIEALRAVLFEYRDRTEAPVPVAEEEQDNARLRLALKSAQRGRADVRGELYGEQAQHRTTVEQRNEHVRELVRLRARVAELEALTPAPIQTCRSCGAGYDYGHPCSMCEFKKRLASAIVDGPDALPRELTPEQARRIERDRPETATSHHCTIPLTRRLDCGHCPHEVCQDCDRCPHTCHCASPEDPHDSPLHRTYETGHDLPPFPGACEACGDTDAQWCPDCAACQRGCFGGHDDNSCTHANAPWRVTP